MKSAYEWKKIFCLEGSWENNLKDESSVKPALSLLHKQYPKMRYIHKECATESEFKFYINKWMQKGYSDYPILYLAFHGEEEKILLSDGNIIELSELSDMLYDSCKNKIIIFASCSTLNIGKRIIKRFISKTDCLAVCGYRTDVDWIKSVAFEILLLEGIQDNEFSGRGIGAISKILLKTAKSFPDLGFRMVTNKE